MNTLSKILAALTAGLVVAGPIVHAMLPAEWRDPRGVPGMTLGFVALACIIFCGLYSVRRLRLWRKWGRLEIWLALHTYLGVIALLATLLHADWRFQPGVATAALLLLTIVTISGLVGWAIYIIYPPRMPHIDDEAITPEEIYHRMEKIQRNLEKVEKRSRNREHNGDGLDEDNMAAMEAELVDLKKKLDYEFRQESLLGAWLYVHIPLSAALIVAVFVHAFMTFYL